MPDPNLQKNCCAAISSNDEFLALRLRSPDRSLYQLIHIVSGLIFNCKEYNELHKEVFLSLGACSFSSIDPEIISSMNGSVVSSVDLILDWLCDRSLISREAGNKYRMHRLVRSAIRALSEFSIDRDLSAYNVIVMAPKYNHLIFHLNSHHHFFPIITNRHYPEVHTALNHLPTAIAVVAHLKTTHPNQALQIILMYTSCFHDPIMWSFAIDWLYDIYNQFKDKANYDYEIFEIRCRMSYYCWKLGHISGALEHLADIDKYVDEILSGKIGLPHILVLFSWNTLQCSIHLDIMNADIAIKYNELAYEHLEFMLDLPKYEHYARPLIASHYLQRAQCYNNFEDYFITEDKYSLEWEKLVVEKVSKSHSYYEKASIEIAHDMNEHQEYNGQNLIDLLISYTGMATTLLKLSFHTFEDRSLLVEKAKEQFKMSIFMVENMIEKDVAWNFLKIEYLPLQNAINAYPELKKLIEERIEHDGRILNTIFCDLEYFKEIFIKINNHIDQYLKGDFNALDRILPEILLLVYCF